MSNDTTTPSRRTVVGAMAAGTMATLGSPVGSAQAQTEAKTFVLVHGAWHGGWCWRRVSDQLEKRGHKVFAPTMTGLGERSHLLDAKINLATHVTDIVNVIKWESLQRHRAGRPLLWRCRSSPASPSRCPRRSAVRVPRCLRAGERRERGEPDHAPPGHRGAGAER